MYLQKGQAGKISEDKILSVLVASNLYVPSLTEVGKDLSGFAPLIFYRDYQSFAAVFTSLQLINLYRDKIKDSISVKGEEILSMLAPGHGLVINPGYRIGMEIEEHGIEGDRPGVREEQTLRANAQACTRCANGAACGREPPCLFRRVCKTLAVQHKHNNHLT
jgi:hypothetical protein